MAVTLTAVVVVACAPAQTSTPAPTQTQTPSAPGPTIGPSSGSTTPGQHTTFTVRTPGGTRRTYGLYVPTSVSQTQGDVPLLVALHGGGGSAARFEADSGFDGFAARDGFVVAYPQASRPSGARTTSWNAGDCCGAAARDDVDDVGFLREVITAITDRYRIDPRRIYLVGFSNGGMLAYRAACQLGGLVAAVGVQSATLEYQPCHPARPVSLLGIHGTADDHVPITGGQGSASRAGVDFTPPQQAAAQVAAADGCSSSSATVPDPDIASDRLRTWGGCPAGVDVQFITVPGGTHPWMPASTGLIWSFLAAHPQQPAA